MNGCVVNLNEKGIKTYLKVQFNISICSGKWQSMARYGLDGFWIQQGDSCKHIIVGSDVE